MCKCEKCGRPAACGERLCDQCFLDSLEDEASKNLFSSGRFYEKEKSKDTQT